MTRTPQQIRLGTSFHEAAHAVAAYMLGQRFSKIELFRPGDHREQGEIAGCVWIEGDPIDTIHAAEDRIVGYLAGNTGMMVAWALESLTDEDIGGVEVPAEELSTEELLAVPNGASRAEQFAYYGFRDYRGKPDEQNAMELARAWTASELSALTLMSWCKVRTTDMVNTPRFQNLMGHLAAVVLDRAEASGEMDGALALHLLERADVIFSYGTMEGAG